MEGATGAGFFTALPGFSGCNGSSCGRVSTLAMRAFQSSSNVSLSGMLIEKWHEIYHFATTFVNLGNNRFFGLNLRVDLFNSLLYFLFYAQILFTTQQ